MAEEVARLGASVIGVDPSPSSITTARKHAAETGLDIDYRIGSGEHCLPTTPARTLSTASTSLSMWRTSRPS